MLGSDQTCWRLQNSGYSLLNKLVEFPSGIFFPNSALLWTVSLSPELTDGPNQLLARILLRAS